MALKSMLLAIQYATRLGLPACEGRDSISFDLHD